MTSPSRTYRNREQWQSLIKQWQQTDLSASAFCKQQSLGYASFCKWRKQLTEEEQQAATPSPDFISLSPLPPVNDSQPQLHLRIGSWLELRIQH